MSVATSPSHLNSLLLNSESFALGSSSPTRRRRSLSVTAFLEDDEDVRGGKYDALFSSIQTLSRRESVLNDAGLSPFAAASANVPSADVSPQQAVQKQKQQSKPGKPQSTQRGHSKSPPRLAKTSAPSGNPARHASPAKGAPRPASQSARTRKPMYRKSPSPAFASRHAPNHPAARHVPIRCVSPAHVRHLGVVGTAPATSTHTKPVLTKAAAALARDPSAHAGAAPSSPTGRQRRKSFIETFAVSDDEPWITSVKSSRAREDGTTRGRSMSSLGLLPARTVMRQYAEDVSAFKGKALAVAGAPPPPLSPTLLQSDSKSPLDDASTLLRRSDRTKTGVPSNVVVTERVTYPSGVMHVWRSAPRSSGASVDADAWMRPLQESAMPKRRVKASDSDIPGMTAAREDVTEMDDDYNELFQLNRRGGSKNTVTATAVHEDAVSGNTAHMTAMSLHWEPNSIAACSALLREPQQLLDSDALRSSVPVSRHQFTKNVNRLVKTFAMGSTRASLFRPTTQRFQFVLLSHPAKVLYAAILYLRTLGGFPTLLRINPLTENSDVIGKEHCIELVFAAPNNEYGNSKTMDLPNRNTTNSSRNPTLNTRRRLSVTRAEAFTNTGIAAPGGASPSNPNWGTSSSPLTSPPDSDELVIVVRSVLAEKSVVKRFGGTEIVHVLPPLEGEVTALPDSIGAAANPTDGKVIRNDAIFRLLGDVDSKSDRMTPRRLGGTASSRMNAAGSGGRSRNGEPDYGDLAVAFLMSATASQLTSELPEPADLEMMRYKVFSLKQDDPDGLSAIFTQPGSHPRASMSVALNQQHPSILSQERQKKKSTFEVELMKMSTLPSMGRNHEADMTAQKAASGNPSEIPTQTQWIELRRRFPPYHSVTVAESTLTTKGDKNVSVKSKKKQVNSKNQTESSKMDEWELLDGSLSPNFKQLRLPRFHADFADAMVFALQVQLRQTSDKASRVNMF